MLHFIGKRIMQSVIVFLIVIFCAFMLVRLAPGSPALLLLPPEATLEQIEAMEERLGLNRPLHIQFWDYLSGVLRGDLGTSFTLNRPVTEVILQRLPNTIRLAAGIVFVGCLMAIPLGIIAGSNKGTLIDFFSMLFALLGQSMSSIWLAVLFIYIFAVQLGWLPALGTGGIRYMILPVMSMAYPMSASLTRVARSGMVDTLSEDYITATYAKGVGHFEVYTKYALRNALIPVVTMAGLNLGIFLAGSVVIETVFSWSGIGQLMHQSVNSRDYYMVQALLLVSAIMFTIINLVVDIINSFIDPRLSLY